MRSRPGDQRESEPGEQQPAEVEREARAERGAGEVALDVLPEGREIARAEQDAEQGEGCGRAQDLCQGRAHASLTRFQASQQPRQRPMNIRLSVQKMPLAAA